MAATPSRRGPDMARFNDQMRETDIWRNFMIRAGFGDGQGGVRSSFRLSDAQRRDLKRELERSGLTFSRGFEIDPAGNVNSDAGFDAHAAKWGPIAGQVGLGIATGGMSLPASLALNAGAGAGIGALRDRSVRGALTGAATGAASAVGGHYLRGAMNGGQAAQGGLLPSRAIPGMHTAIPGAVTGSQAVSAGIPASLLAGLGQAAGKGGDLATAASGGGGLLGKIGRGIVDHVGTPKGALSLASLIPMLTGAGRQNIADNPDVKRQMDIANQSQQMQFDRYKRTDPLHEATVRLAYSMLPMSARQGGAATPAPPPQTLPSPAPPTDAPMDTPAMQAFQRRLRTGQVQY